jgi:hypothetical protein
LSKDLNLGRFNLIQFPLVKVHDHTLVYRKLCLVVNPCLDISLEPFETLLGSAPF